MRMKQVINPRWQGAVAFSEYVETLQVSESKHLHNVGLRLGRRQVPEVEGATNLDMRLLEGVCDRAASSGMMVAGCFVLRQSVNTWLLSSELSPKERYARDVPLKVRLFPVT